MPRRAPALMLAAVVALAGAPARAGSGGQDFSQIERGRYLTIASDCAGCHTRDGGKPFAGGRRVETPFGTLIGSNITPDRETGIGRWSDDDFVGALTQGIRRDGAHLYPAMPYPAFTKLTRADILAIRAYLDTVEPVTNRVVENQLPFPLDMRAGMAAWNALNFTPGTFRPVAGKSAEWNRGAYLVQGPMHCGTCHTPKDFMGADEDGHALQGNVVQGWTAPDITDNARHGLGHWSVEEIAAYLKTGHNSDAAASGPMAEEIRLSSSRMTQADLRAVAVYLKDQPGSQDAVPAVLPATDPVMKTGAAIYADACSACHTPLGTGVPGLFPRLAGGATVQSDDPTSLIRVVVAGARSVATDAAPTGPAMPAFGWLLDDRETAAVLTYIRGSWGNAAAPVDEAQVRRVRGQLAERSD